MKKIFLFAAMAVMGLSTVSCSKSDDNKADYKENIKATWSESKIQYLNKDKGVILEIAASNNNGCGVDYVTYTDKEYIETYNYKDSKVNECKKEKSTYIYKLLGKFITAMEKEGDNLDVINQEVIELTSNKLVLLDTDKVDPRVVEGKEYPKGTVYIQKVYIK